MSGDADKSRAKSAVQSLSQIIGHLPEPLTHSDDPSTALLNDSTIATSIAHRLRSPGSGAGGDNLCRWLYDTFQSGDPSLQVVVLNFVPTLVGVYLSRAISRKPLAGFEAVILAIYASETVARNGEPQTLSLPNLAQPSVYHEGFNQDAPISKSNSKKGAAEPAERECTVAVVSTALEPHGTIRSTKRARIVGVALELYYSKISRMSIASKLEFCEFCVAWAGNCGTSAGETMPKITNGEERGEKKSKGDGEKKEKVDECRRIPLPWELFQPILRILGHCILGQFDSSEQLKTAAIMATSCLNTRATHDMHPQAILASRSLLRLSKMEVEPIRELSISATPADKHETVVA